MTIKMIDNWLKSFFLKNSVDTSMNIIDPSNLSRNIFFHIILFFKGNMRHTTLKQKWLFTL